MLGTVRIACPICFIPLLSYDRHELASCSSLCALAELVLDISHGWWEPGVEGGSSTLCLSPNRVGGVEHEEGRKRSQREQGRRKRKEEGAVC